MVDWEIVYLFKNIFFEGGNPGNGSEILSFLTI
jgi:hypothetical protein